MLRLPPPLFFPSASFIAAFLKPAAVCKHAPPSKILRCLGTPRCVSVRARVHRQECLLMFTGAAKCVFLRRNLYLDRLLFLSRKRRLMSVSLSAGFMKSQGKPQVAAVRSNEPRRWTTEDGRKFTHSCKHDAGLLASCAEVCPQPRLSCSHRQTSDLRSHFIYSFIHLFAIE